MRRLTTILCLSLLCLGMLPGLEGESVVPHSVEADTSEDGIHSPRLDVIQRHAAALAALGDRSPGSPGADEALAYIRQQLLAAGLDESAIWEQRTSIVVPHDHGSRLHDMAGHEDITLLPHMPNSTASAGTGGETLRGRLVILDRQQAVDLKGVNLQGSIVVLDADSGDTWMRCAQMGAQAVIFRYPSRMNNAHLRQQHLSASLPFPRFVVEDIPDTLAGAEVSLTSTVTFATRQAGTLVARITAPEQDRAAANEEVRDAVLLASGYESEGSIRGASPGATRIWNAALLLALAEQYQQQPLSRDVILVFHGARPEFFRGLRQLLGVLTDPSAERRVRDELGQQALMGDNILSQLHRQLWRAEEIEQDFRDFLALVESEGLTYEESETRLRELLSTIRNPPAELLVGGLDVAEADNEDQAVSPDRPPLLSITQWILVALLSLGLASILLYGRPGTQGATACMLAYVLLIAWIIAERPQSAAVLKEGRLRAEERLLLELGHRFISEEAAGFADAIRPQMREMALLASYGARAGVDAQEVAEAEEAYPRLEREHRLWRDIQQKAGRRWLDDGSDGTMEEMQQLPMLIERILGIGEHDGRDIARHKSILSDRIADMESSIAIRNALGETRLMHLLAVDLSDGNTRWSAALHGPWMRWPDRSKPFADGLREISRDLNAGQLKLGIPYDRDPNDQSDMPEAFWPEGYLHDAGVASAFVNSVSLSTTNDRRLRLGSPADTMEAFRSQHFLSQTQGMTALIRSYLDGNVINRRHEYRNARWRSPIIRSEIASEGSTTGRKSYSYPLVQLNMGRPEAFFFGDVRHVESWWGDALGELRLPWLPERMPNAFGSITISVAGHDSQGNITQMTASAGTQARGAATDRQWNLRANFQDLKPVVFDAEVSWLFGVFDPRLLLDLSNVTALSASRDAAPDFAHVEVDRGCAAIFVPPGTPLRVLASEGQIGNRMALVGPPSNEALTDFAGLAGGQKLSQITAIDAAQDLFNLNEGRLAILRRNGVNPESMLFLHSETERFLEQARESLEQGDNAAAEGAGQAAWAMAGRVYPNVLATANDVVYGLVVMLLFAIPFAAICERLFIAGNTIFKRVGGFLVFFSLIFLFFFFFHPAFALATTPVIIFLAFAIIVMSALVIVIIFNRFEHEMEMIRMAGLGMHKVDVSRLGTLLATVTLGISNMRRRPLRTFLTAITVVLMTFILLTFASFNSTASTRRVTVDVPPTFQGIMLRQNGWLPLSDRAVTRISNTWQDRFTLHERRWLDAESTGGRYSFSAVDGSGSSFIEAVVGIEPNDPSGVEEALIRPDDDLPGLGEGTQWIFLPQESLYQAGIEIGDHILFMGKDMRVGLLDTTLMSGITHMDGDPFTPLQPSPQTDEQRAEAQRMQAEAAGGEVALESGSFIHLGSRVVAVTHVDNVRQLGGDVRSLALQPRSEEVDVMEMAEEMAQQLAMSLRVGRGADTYLMTGVGRLSVAGLSDVLIPLVLGGMIIFSTMLGSVAERGKEIFIYASLGLAPLHIGVLFLVEASIYAVIGGLGGYILAQFVVAVLGLAAELGIGVRPDLNYSSFTAVITILLVMATVLISAIYPALVASKAANPGTDNSFRVPDPDGDNMEIPFPFTVSRRDIVGLFAYLASYLEAHSEASTGCFTAAEASMSSTWDGYSVTAKTWLAPFDLGISQQFTISAKPTDVKAIFAIHISMELLSGQRSAWKRVTVPFLRELRKQFLVWRTLDDETTDRYRAKGGDKEAEKRMQQREEAAQQAAIAALAEKERAKQAMIDKQYAADDQAEEASS